MPTGRAQSLTPQCRTGVCTPECLQFGSSPGEDQEEGESRRRSCRSRPGDVNLLSNRNENLVEKLSQPPEHPLVPMHKSKFLTKQDLSSCYWKKKRFSGSLSTCREQQPSFLGQRWLRMCQIVLQPELQSEHGHALGGECWVGCSKKGIDDA